MTDEKDGLAKLRVPFAANQISLLPKPYKKESPKGKCAECGGYHGLPAVHLSYVGHAALTDRLLDTDPNWTWEPLALDSHGLPFVDGDGGMWIKLTVLGVTRLGYGDAQGKTGANAVKERIGDALRNAAMRFGAALDLWHKGDLHADEDTDKETGEIKPAAEAKPAGKITPTTGVLGKLSAARQEVIIKTANLIEQQLRDDQTLDAYGTYTNCGFDTDEYVALRGLLNSKTRSTLKRMWDEEQGAEPPKTRKDTNHNASLASQA